ncbi:MAG TPA: Uma2 family endonuclease [Longimicrobiaceae bacterium]|nr:Uma2 family endonuclease [Longimicrobiaceae bacterium]
MAQTAASVAVTADELLRMPDDGLRRELVRGELREMTPAGYRHGSVAMRIGSHLHVHVEANDLGVAFAAETGFRLESAPDTVRAPDAAFVRKERVDATDDPEGFWPGAPDLAVEVVSPGDSFGEVEEKVFDWLAAGCRMVVVVNPRKRTATVYRSRSDIVVLTEDDELDGRDVVSGWRLPVREIFA